MVAQTIDTPHYLLYPSPHNQHRVVFEHQYFTPHLYALIHLPDFGFEGRATLFSAQRKSDGRMGQLVSCEQQSDIERFQRLFEPD